MADLTLPITEGAFVAIPGICGADYEGFVISKVSGITEYHWVRIQGVNPHTGSPSHARLEVSASLEQLLGGSGALAHVCSRLRSGPSVQHFLADLQEVLERLAYGSSAGPGPGSSSTGVNSSSSSSRTMQLLLRDLDEIGWACLEELDQDTARMTVVHLDEHGREHRLRLTLPYDYPASAPSAATDLPVPLAFSWRPPPLSAAAAAYTGPNYCGYGGAAAPPFVGHTHSGWASSGDAHQQHGYPYQRRHGTAGGAAAAGGDAGAAGGACSSLADVFVAFKQAVSSLQPLWRCLDSLDRRTRVLDPPPALSAARRHIAAPSRRLALGGAASLTLRLDPLDPFGPPPAEGVAFLGPPDAVGGLREAFFGRLHLWSRDSDPVGNLELLLGQSLPRPPPGGGGCGGFRGVRTANLEAAGDRHHHNNRQDEDEVEQIEQEEEAPVMAECPICMMHLLPLGEDEGEGEGNEAGGGGGGGLLPDAVCPTPACGLAFHTPCLAEWLRSLHDTRVSFGKLFGRCPFCSNPITVRA